MYRKKLTILETPKTDTWAGTSDCGHRHSVNTWEHKHLYLNIIPHSLPHGSLSIVTQNHIRGEYGEQQKLSTSPFFLPQFSPSISRDAVPLPMEEKGTSFSRWTSQSHCSSLPNGRGELPSWHRRSLNPHSEGQKRIQTFWWWELSFSNSHQYYCRIIGHLRQLKTLIQDSSPLLFSPHFALLARGHLIHYLLPRMCGCCSEDRHAVLSSSFTLLQGIFEFKEVYLSG